MSIRVFISYSSHDRSVAEDLERELERRGDIVFRDKNVMRGGGDWEQRILPLVADCEKFVLLWSSAASESLPVAQELTQALARKVDILPLRLDDTTSNPLLRSIHEFDGRIVGVSAVLDALNPSISPTSFADLQTTALIRSYRRILHEEVANFPVLLTSRADSAEHVIRLNVSDELGEHEDDFKTRTLDIVSMLQGVPGDSTILIGHPGSGKSTSARYLVKYLLDEESTNTAGGMLPFLAHCRLFSHKKYNSILDFIYTQVGYLVGFQMAEALEAHDVARQPGTVLIIDGFDELPSGTASAFLDQLFSLKEDPDFRGAHIVLTSRFDAYRQFEQRFHGWRKLALAPLSSAQIVTFVKSWFGDGTATRELLDQIQEPRLAELAIRPFLLAMMCLVKEDGGNIGRSRSELYSKAIAYLERRQANIVPASTRAVRRRVLEDLSMRMLQLGGSDIDRWTAAGITAAAVAGPGAQISPSFEDCIDLLDSLTRDVGITQIVLGHYSFVHRTFMEYLSACKLNLLGNGDSIAVEYCRVARWEEPIRLYAGMQTSAARQADIVKQLWKENPALALRTLTDARTVDRSVVESLIADSDSSERVRMLRTLRASFRDVDHRTRLRLVIETTEPLLSGDTNSEVVYNAVSLLRWVDPEDASNVLWNAFGSQSALKRRQLIEDPTMFFSFVALPGGDFMMGDDQAIDAIEKPAHLVTLSPFQINAYQVTNLAYEFVTGRPPEHRHPVSSRDRQPVVDLNWFEAYVFALRIGCRLPTEAEWEYAARAGSNGSWCFGDDPALLPYYANFEEQGNAKREPWDVGTGQANSFGLYDMHGNVWEWCADWLGPYPNQPLTDPQGPENGHSRVRRGGGFAYHSRGCRSAFRWGNDPIYRFKDIGVRVALDKVAMRRGW